MAVSAFAIVASRETASRYETASRDEEARWVTDVLLLLMATIWGVNFSVIKYGTRFIAPLAFNGTRIPIAAATQLGLATALRLERVPAALAWRLILLGMLGNGAYQVLFILGVVRTRVATAALIVAATPAFIAILGRLFGTEQLTARQWCGIALQIVGCSTVVMGSARGLGGTDSFAGGALLLGAALSWAIYSVLLRRLDARVHVLQLGGYTMLGGAVVTSVVALPALIATEWSTLPPSAVWAILYSAIGAMVFAYLFWYRGLRILGATRTAVYSNLQPVIAAIVAYLAFHEVPTIAQAIGATFVISGLLLTRR
jgi:drug/metabolite transporter (DMT)-like permease